MKIVRNMAIMIMALGVFICGAANYSIAQQSQMTATLAQGGEGLIWFPAYVAKANKYFEEENLNLKIIITPGGSEATAAVLGGSADFADSIHHAMKAQLQGQDLVVVADAMDQYGLLMVVSKKALEKTGLKKGDSLEKVIKGMKGLRIGITSPGSSTDLVTRALFNRYGINPDREAVLIPFGTGGPMLAAIETDQTDAFIYTSPFPETVVARGRGEVLINLTSGDVKELSGYPYTAYFASRKVINEKPQVVQAFVNAIYKAELFIHKYPEKAIAIAKVAFKDMDSKVLEDAVINTVSAIPQDPIVSRAQVEVALNWLKYSPEDRAKMPFERLVDNRFAFKAIETISGIKE